MNKPQYPEELNTTGLKIFIIGFLMFICSWIFLVIFPWVILSSSQAILCNVIQVMMTGAFLIYISLQIPSPKN